MFYGQSSFIYCKLQIVNSLVILEYTQCLNFNCYDDDYWVERVLTDNAHKWMLNPRGQRQRLWY